MGPDSPGGALGGWEGTCPRECLPVLASGVGAGAVRACVLPCSVSFIQGSDRCLSFEGLPEEAFEHLTNLNYLYLANNKVRGPQQGGVLGPELRELLPRPLPYWLLGPLAAQTRPRPHTLTRGIRVVR